MTPRPLPPDQIKPVTTSVGIEDGRGSARKPARGDKCACGTYLDDDGRCVNADMEHRLAPPPPPPPAPEGWAVPEIRSPRLPDQAPEDFAIPELGQRKPSEKRNEPPGALRRFLRAMRGRP